MEKITADEAARLIRDGDSILISGSGGGHAVPEALLAAVERRFLADGKPTGLTSVSVVGVGDRAALGYENQSVRLLIMTDAAGVVRVADIAPADAARVGTGVARAFAERARRAALDPECARLPLPPAMRGRAQTFEITFRP